MQGTRLHRDSRLERVLVVLAPLLLLYALISLHRLPEAPSLGHHLRQFTITDVTPGGPADRGDIRSGDEVLSVNGVPRERTVDLFVAWGAIRPGDSVLYTITRDGEVLERAVTAEEKLGNERLSVILRTIVGICFVALGLIVYWNRADQVATLFYLAGLAFGFMLIEPPPTASIPLQFLIKIGSDFSILFVAPVFLQLFLKFPRRKTIPRALFLIRPVQIGSIRMRFPLYWISAMIFGLSLILSVQLFFSGLTWSARLLLFQTLTALYLLVCLLAGIAAFLHSYLTTKSPQMKKKLRGVAIGTTIALLPMAATNVIKMIRPDTEVPGGTYLILLATLLPLSFGHAIIRYGLLDLELIIKRSILYTLLTAFLGATYVFLVDLTGGLLKSSGGNTSLPATLVSLFLIALLFSPVRNRIQDWVDRTFYREKYRYRRTLHEFSRAITSILDLDRLVQELVERISTTLHVPDVGIFISDDNGQHLLQAGAGAGRPRGTIVFGEDDHVIHLLKKNREAFPIERITDGEGTFILPDEEKAKLEQLGTSLLMPLISGDRLAGIVSLGRKQSGEFYSAEDRQLLNTLANQATLAIENAKLHKETLEKERMKQELRLAREIQLHFLPPAPPTLPHVDVAAVNVPCEEVGGDYYDYVIGEDGSLGIVVGDAVGHGVTAALLMASLQATFRAEARCSRSTSETMMAINEEMHARTASGRFVTLFYGRLEAEGGVFRYSNAGHNPPVLVRQDGSVDSLDGAELILGVEGTTEYREHLDHLDSGDLLLLYTDGLTDEPNSRDEYFGVDRVVEIARENRTRSASIVANAIYREVVTFLEEPVSDDITLLVLKKR